MIKCVSFDLQGTITDAEFCDSLWIKILPEIYAMRNKVSIDKAKKLIKSYYEKEEIYDIKYYDDSFWTKMLKFDAIKELENRKIKPKINEKLMSYIKKIKEKKIIVSTTTNLFIDVELGKEKENFDKIYSCVDYFNIGGKIPKVFRKIANELNILPNEILHIGDNYVMDVENAKKAGVNAIHFKGNVTETINEINKYLEVKSV